MLSYFIDHEQPCINLYTIHDNHIKEHTIFPQETWFGQTFHQVRREIKIHLSYAMLQEYDTKPFQNQSCPFHSSKTFLYKTKFYYESQHSQGRTEITITHKSVSTHTQCIIVNFHHKARNKVVIQIFKVLTSYLANPQFKLSSNIQAYL